VCPTAPVPTCIDAGKHSLLIRDNVINDRDIFKWKWAKGGAFDQIDLGDPESTTSYTLCVYDSSGGVDSLATSFAIAPGSNWTDIDPKGFKYKDKFRTSSGVLKAQIRTGDLGRTKALVIAKGGNVPMPAPFGPTFFEQSPRVTVQLHNDATSTCLGSEFTSNKKNTTAIFKATAP